MIENTERHPKHVLLPILGGISKANNRILSFYRKLESPSKLSDISKGIYDDSQKIIDNINLIATEKRLKIVGFVSSQPNEGTSTIAYITSLVTINRQNGYFKPYSNGIEDNNRLDLPSSEHKQGVILIDTQFKHPTLHDLFKITIAPGLIDYLVDNVSYHEIIRENCFPHLSVITAGRTNHHRLTKGNYEQLKIFLAQLRKKFEFIFLDIPPLLHYTEGIGLSKLCDGIILIVRANKTKREVVNESKSLLEKAGVTILGSILNRRKFFIPDLIYHKL